MMNLSRALLIIFVAVFVAAPLHSVGADQSASELVVIPRAVSSEEEGDENVIMAPWDQLGTATPLEAVPQEVPVSQLTVDPEEAQEDQKEEFSFDADWDGSSDIPFTFDPIQTSPIGIDDIETGFQQDDNNVILNRPEGNWMTNVWFLLLLGLALIGGFLFYIAKGEGKWPKSLADKIKKSKKERK